MFEVRSEAHERVLEAVEDIQVLLRGKQLLYGIERHHRLVYTGILESNRQTLIGLTVTIVPYSLV